MLNKRKAKKDFAALILAAKAVVDLAQDAEGSYLGEDYEGAEFCLGGAEEEIDKIENLIMDLGTEIEERIDKI